MTTFLHEPHVRAVRKKYPKPLSGGDFGVLHRKKIAFYQDLPLVVLFALKDVGKKQKSFTSVWSESSAYSLICVLS
jgi:hypothetical protein